MKRIVFLMLSLGMAVTLHAQWTAKDSVLMTIFTKDFWDKKGRNRRSRTLEVLKAYGDSTTVLLPEPIVH